MRTFLPFRQFHPILPIISLRPFRNSLKLASAAAAFRPSLRGIHSPLLPLFLLLLNAISAQNEAPSFEFGHPIARFQNGQRVQGIASAGSLLAVLFADNSLALFHQNGTIQGNWTKLWEINLETNEALTDLQMPPNSGQILLLCFTTECRICPLPAQHAPSLDQCQFHKFDQPLQSLRTATTPEGRLFLRPIYSPDKAAIQAIDARNGRLEAVDYVQTNDHRVYAGFHRGAYVYFLGSANRVDLAYRVDMDAETKWRTDVRLSRICQGDTSRMGEKGLESRMELALSCKGLDDDPRIPHVQRAIGASLGVDGKTLLVAIEREEEGEEGESSPEIRNLVCRFKMDELEAAFNALWDTCQTVQSNSYLMHECKGSMEKAECFMYSWELSDDRYSLCRRFGPGKVSQQPPMGNCQLNSTDSKQFRAGWLENFKPTMGQIVAELPAPLESPIVGLRESPGGEAFLVAFQNGTIQRFRIEPHEKDSFPLANPLWTIQSPTPLGPFGMEIDPESGNLLFANGDEVYSMGMDCAGMYPKCEQIVWTDPLQCLWCHFSNSTGRTVGRNGGMEECQGRGGLPLESCPPSVTEVTREEGGMLTIWGNRLDTMEKPRIVFCGQQCQLDKQSANTIRCKMASIPPNECQTLSLKGQFGSVQNFAVNHDLSKDGKLDENGRYHQSYIYRVLLVIVAILLMTIVLIVIYCSLYPKYARRLLKLAFFRSGRNGGGAGGTNTATYRPIPSSTDFISNPIQNAEPFAGRHPSFGASPWRSGGGCHHPNSHTLIHDGIFGIENLVVTLADGSQLDQGTFECIGEGYFSKVCRAICRRGPEEEKGYFVAVKIIKNASSLAEIRQEVAMISKCRHPNIVQYIDHFVSELGLIHIVIEYMGGGDLHRFLTDWKNMPTIGDAFSYILQVADGMRYLTEQRIVHRDLAARNCMLDADFQIVKITDFGLSRVLTKSKLMNDDNAEDNYVYIYMSGNQQQQLPYRWTAIECFCADPLFSEKTDVWAFGILIWEIFARNRVPYGEMKSQDVKKFLETGGRLEQQMHCPRELYELMKQCWSADSTMRPAFSEIRLRVQRIFDDLMAQDAEYMQTQYEPLAGTEYEAPRPSVSGSAGPINTTLSSTATTIVAHNSAL